MVVMLEYMISYCDLIGFSLLYTLLIMHGALKFHIMASVSSKNHRSQTNPIMARGSLYIGDIETEIDMSFTKCYCTICYILPCGRLKVINLLLQLLSIMPNF